MAGIHLWGNSINKEDVSFQSFSISSIDKRKSPVLLIHGDDDRNVAFSQTTGLVQLLRAKGIYYELIVYPDDVHDSLLYRRWLKSFHATDDFFKQKTAYEISECDWSSDVCSSDLKTASKILAAAQGILPASSPEQESSQETPAEGEGAAARGVENQNGEPPNTPSAGPSRG